MTLLIFWFWITVLIFVVLSYPIYLMYRIKKEMLKRLRQTKKEIDNLNILLKILREK